MGIGALGYRLLKRFDPGILEEFDDRVAECVFSDPQLAAKFFPYQGRLRTYLLPKSPRQKKDTDTSLAIPPKDLWWYAKTPEDYLANGHKRAEETREILRATGFTLAAGHRMLDFGSASGIMLRWFRDIAETGEAWGVDMFSPAIVWCQQNLSPPFKFATTTSFPHLPFEDRYFDFVYAGSVFTHIADLAETWLLELRRIVRPGGRLFITVHDNESIRYILDEGRQLPLAEPLRSLEAKTHFRTEGFAMFAINRAPGPGAPGQAQVFYDLDYIRQQWSNYLTVITTVPRVWGGKQTAIVLER
jgi:SAM-dependent methyltransferase